jgi:hypothetical protein
MFQWYNLLHKSGNLKLEDDKTVSTETTEENKEAVAGEGKEGVKKSPAKKTTTAKPKATVTDKSKSAKPAAAKKVTTPKTSSNRGK